MYLSECLIKNFNLSPKNYYEVYKLLGKSAHKINPNYYSKLCGTTGLVVFYVKDALEYMGLLEEKKTLANAVLNCFENCIEHLDNCVVWAKKKSEMSS